jgi:ABC-2 type transport system ATP-binding protein
MSIMSGIECSHLGLRYDNTVAVDDVSFSVEPGEFFAFLGPNGAGKTSTFQILITMLRPAAGEARVLGFDVVHQAAEVRARIGVVFQEPALDERLTASENLLIHAALYGLPSGQVRAKVSEALEWATLGKVAARPVRTFSGGMKRRLELARALLHRPQVLFLDEPTVGLDPQGRRHLWESIAGLRGQGLTVFMTTHYLHEAEGCDRVGIIDQGRLVALDTPAALKQQVLGRPQGSLEEVFMALTGRALRDEEATPKDRMLGFRRRGGEHTR